MKLSLRVWLLLIIVILSILAIHPTFQKGVLVKSSDKNSMAFSEGLRGGAIITELNGQQITSMEDYTAEIAKIFPSQEPVRLDISASTGEFTIYGNESPNMVISDIPKTKIKTGLDIQGGARALVKPEAEITDSQLQDLIQVSQNRFNAFGISDVTIRGVQDLAGNQYMLVEVAGATPSDLQDLVAKQGKFEAKIGNETVFAGGDEDIVSVCRNDASCAAVTQCSPGQGGYVCQFSFAIYLSEEAAKRHADITSKLSIDPTSGGRYLSEKLDLILDDITVDSLYVSTDLKGKETTQISVQGSGTGLTQKDAYDDAKASMNKLQTVLITGSLPYKLEIVKLDTISPALGEQFVYLILLAGFCSILAVSIIIFARYRKFKISLALLLTSFSEIIIILGFAAFLKWNLDLPSIAGILATIGTGVDQQIVILDEARSHRESSLKERMKRALFVVTTAYFTALVSLLPLYWAGAGLFKGFAFTSIIGITAGVLVTRPAFADIVKRMEE